MTPASLLATIAPDLATLDTAADAIVIADMQIGPKLCGERRPLLVAYLAAHVLALSQRTGGASGSVSGLSEGGLSVSFSGGIAGDALQSTSYGAEYDRISKGCTFAARTRVTSVVRHG